MKFWKSKNKIKYRFEKIKNILKDNKIDVPKCQRRINEDRLSVMKVNFKNKFNPITPIYLCLWNNKRWIIDGQHRLKLYSEVKELMNEKIPIIEIYVKSEAEVNEYFLLINEQLTFQDVNRVEENLRNIILNTSDYFFKKYPNGFKNKTKFKKANSPYMWDDIFIEQLKNLIIDEEKDIIKRFDIKNSEEFINILEGLNEKYSKQDANFFKKSESTLNRVKKKNMLYFGLLKENWMDNIIEFTEPEYIGTLTQSTRFACWNNYIGREIAISKCWCCNQSEISQQLFEAGHIMSRKTGGKNNVENLRPICSKCNREMGTTHMFKFMKNMNYKHQEEVNLFE